MTQPKYVEDITRWCEDMSSDRVICNACSKQANREYIKNAVTRFSRVTYFFISSLVKIWKIPVFYFTVKHP